jgi:hypothetical protein
MEIKDSFGYKPVKETIDVNEKKDLPLYMQPSSYGNYNAMVSSGMKGVKHSEKAMINKSDYTQRKDK